MSYHKISQKKTWRRELSSKHFYSKVFYYSSMTYGDSRVCVLRCISRFCFVPKTLSQSEQLKRFGLCWVILCWKRTFRCLKQAPHSEHLWVRSPCNFCWKHVKEKFIDSSVLPNQFINFNEALGLKLAVPNEH
jgi:hypothetical protein